MTPERTWRDLTTAALVGIERGRLPEARPAGPLGELLASAAEREPEVAALEWAGLLSVYLRAGWRPAEAAESAPEPALPEERPAAPPAAANHLERMLGRQFREALPEWLSLAARHGKRVPPALLPALLEAGRLDRALRPLIVPVVGRRGSWLAAQNAAWAYSVGAGESEDGGEEAWETGSREARRLALERMRREDPAAARGRLETAWPSEAPDDRADLLQALQVGLSPDDEPFLEAALDDRRKEVRRIAADLLACLPGSALVGRMRERLRPLLEVRMTGGVLGVGRKLALSVQPPEQCDRGMTRDGVDPKPPAAERALGEKAWWLAQMVGAVPPAEWTREASVPALQVLEAGRKTEWASALMEGWATAAVRHRDQEWAQALLTRNVAPARHHEALLGLLSPERQEATALALLSEMRGPLRGGHPGLSALHACRGPWSDALVRAVLGRIRDLVADAGARSHADWSVQALLRQIGYAADPRLLDEVSRGWPEESPGWEVWKPSVDEFLGILQFRREMHEEIAR